MFPYGNLRKKLLAFGRDTPGDRRGLFIPTRREDFVKFVRLHTDLLVLHLNRLLVDATEMPTERGAEARAQLFVDHTLHLWLSWLAVAAWRRRDFGEEAIDEGMRDILKAVAGDADRRTKAKPKPPERAGGSP